MSTTAIPERDVQARWEVSLPIHFTSLNRLMRMHWSRRDRTLKDEALAILWFCNVAGVPIARGKRRVTQRITLIGRDRKRDSDNGFKGLLDGLVKARRLVDDGPDWVETRPIEHDRGAERKTVITLEDIES